MTLLDIKNHMLNYLANKEPKGETAYYDEDGYCGKDLYQQIITFWNKFSSDEDFVYLISGKWISDDLDLEGGRKYFLSSSRVIPMIFEYLTTTLKWDKVKYKGIIYNSLIITDDIEDLYDGLSSESVKETRNIVHPRVKLKLVDINQWESIYEAFSIPLQKLGAEFNARSFVEYLKDNYHPPKKL